MATLAHNARTSKWHPIDCRICKAVNVIPDDAATALCGNCNAYLILEDAKHHVYWGPTAGKLADVTAPAIVSACMALAAAVCIL